MKIVLTCLLLAFAHLLQAQVGIGTTTPATSAALDITSTSKGLLPPRMTWKQIQAIPSPVVGLTVYDLSAGGLRLYDGRSWQLLSAHGDASLQDAPGFFQSFPISGGVSIESVFVLPNKNLLIAGNASAGAIISGITIPATVKFFGLLDSNGAGLWMKSITGNIFTNITRIKADATGTNFYICGSFYGTIDFNPDPAVTNNLVSDNTGVDGFIARYDMAGNYVWAVAAGGTGNQYVTDIAITSTQIYAGGYFNGALSLGAGYTSNGGDDGWAARFSRTTGALGSWIFRIGGTGNDAVRSIAMKSSSELLVGGSYTGGVPYGNSTVNTDSLAGFGNTDGFVGSLPVSGGSGIVMKRLGSSATDHVFSVAAVSGGDIYVAGSYSNGANFSLNGTGQNVNSAGGTDGFVAIYTNTFDLQAASTIGGSQSDVITDIALTNNHLLILGEASNATWGSLSTQTEGSYDLFLGAYDLFSGPVWLQQAGGRFGDEAHAIAASADGKLIYTSGTMTVPYLNFERARVNEVSCYLSRYEE